MESPSREADIGGFVISTPQETKSHGTFVKDHYYRAAIVVFEVDLSRFNRTLNNKGVTAQSSSNSDIEQMARHTGLDTSLRSRVQGHAQTLTHNH